MVKSVVYKYLCYACKYSGTSIVLATLVKELEWM